MWICIIRLQSPPPLFRLWCNLVPSTFPRMCRTDRIYKAVELCRKARMQTCTPSQQPALNASVPLAELVQELQDFDVELKNFRDENLAPCSVVASKEAQEHLDWLTNLMNAEGAPVNSYIFKTFGDVSGWLLITSTRMRIHHTILECLDHAQRSPMHDAVTEEASRRHQSMSSVAGLVDDMHAAVLSHLCMTKDDKEWKSDRGDVSSMRGYCLLPAYGMALSVAGTVLQHDPSRVVSFNWARSLLLDLERVLGLARATHLARIYRAFIDGASIQKVPSVSGPEGLLSSSDTQSSRASREKKIESTGPILTPDVSSILDVKQLPSAFMSESVAGGVLVTKYSTWRT